MARGTYKCRIIKRDRDIIYSIIRTALESIDITIKKSQSRKTNDIKIKSHFKFGDFGEIKYLDIWGDRITVLLQITSCPSCLVLIPIAYIDKKYVYNNLFKLMQVKNLLRAIANNYPDFVSIKCERC